MLACNRLTLAAYLGLFAAAFGIELWLFRDVWQSYHPANDDIALILHSTDFGQEPFWPRVKSWFTEGFSNYWYVFPEWSEPHTNYLRPGVNLAFFLLFALIGTWWSGYLIACYALYALVLVLTVDLAFRTYHLRGWPLVVVAISMATTSSAWFNGELFFNPTFAFDAVVTAMIVLAFRAYLARNYFGMTLILAIAVFTKEAALAAAAAAFTGVLLHELPLIDPRRARFVFGRRPAATAAIESPKQGFVRGLAIAGMVGLPVLAWLALRWLAFGDQIGVAVASTGVHSPVLHYIRQLLEWPFNDGMINGESVSALRHRNLLAVSPGFYAQVAANAVFFVLVVVALWQRWRAIQATPATSPPVTNDRAHLFDSCWWLLWLGLMLLLTAVSPRIGHAVTVFAACIIGALWQDARQVWMRRASMALLTVVAVTNVLTSIRLVNNGYLETNIERNRNQLALFALMREHAAPDRQLLVVNDFSSRYASNEDLRRFAGVPGRLTRLNSVGYLHDSMSHRRPPADFPIDSARIRREGDGIVVETQLPDYLRYQFEDVRYERLLQFRDGDSLTTMQCRYHFPDLTVALPQPIDFGRLMRLSCTVYGDFRVIYYDPGQRRYRVWSAD